MIRKLAENNKILCTSRKYREVVELAKLKHINMQLIGKHGGFRKEDKLRASVLRINGLLSFVTRFSPELAISFCSPEAARVSFGLGIKHIVFSDSPHAEAVMRLSLPLVQKLLTPWIIPKSEFEKYGISKKDIIHYKAIDSAVIVKEKSKPISINIKKTKKIIVIRPEESEASYVSGKTVISNKIIQEISKQSSRYNIIILARYLSQKNQLKRKFGRKVIVLDRVVDGKSLLEITDLFIGSGGTMTAEAALMGIPTISYDAAPNFIEGYLVRRGLVRREARPEKVSRLAELMLKDNFSNKEKARKILNSMEDPFLKLVSIIKNIR